MWATGDVGHRPAAQPLLAHVRELLDLRDLEFMPGHGLLGRQRRSGDLDQLAVMAQQFVLIPFENVADAI